MELASINDYIFIDLLILVVSNGIPRMVLAFIFRFDEKLISTNSFEY